MNSIFPQLPDDARVWVYQADRHLSSEEAQRASEIVTEFARKSWSAHGVKLPADATVLYDLFVVLAADGSVEPVSGCSIDSSVAVIRHLGEVLGCDFFNRTMLSFRDSSGDIQLRNINDFWAMRKAGLVGEDTVVFNHLINTLGEFRSGWEVPFRNSWHAEMFT